MLQLKTINECGGQIPITTGCAVSNGKPAATYKPTNINVRFSPISTVELVIKRFAKKSSEKSAIDFRTSLMLANSSTPSM